jgi:hypothetical protein
VAGRGDALRGAAGRSAAARCAAGRCDAVRGAAKRSGVGRSDALLETDIFPLELRDAEAAIGPADLWPEATDTDHHPGRLHVLLENLLG